MLVKRHRHHTRVVIERGLDTVSVVNVDIDVGDLLESLFEKPVDRDRTIVIHAEAGRSIAHRMVHAAGH